MFPIIHLLGKEVGVYAIMALVGALLSGWFVYRQARKRGLDEIEAVVILLFSSIGVFIGMHLLYALTQLPNLPAILREPPPLTPFGDVVNIFLALLGGSVFYGGLLGGLAAAVIYMRHKKLRVPDYLDLLTPAIPLFHFFGRVGCFFGGCCFGVPCPVGFIYTHSPISAANGVRRFPVQLLEALVLLVLWGVLLRLYQNRAFKGRLLYIYLASYAVCRFGLEFLRGDSYRGIAFGLSTSQYISIPLLIFSLYMLLRGKGNKAAERLGE